MDDQATIPYNFVRLYEAGFSVFPVPPLQKKPRTWYTDVSWNDTLGPFQYDSEDYAKRKADANDVTIRPFTGWKPYQTEFADPFTVQEWAACRSFPNIGIATGAISNCFVLDLDNLEALDWVRENRGLPETVMVRTPRGFHVYFRHPGGYVKNRANLKQRDDTLPKGIDIRGDTGFIMAAGSYYVPTEEEIAKGKQAGPYRFVEGRGIGEIEMAEAPAWLLDVMADAPYVPIEPDDRPIPDAYAAKAIENALDSIASASRGSTNDTLNGVSYGIGRIVGAGALDYEETKTLLIDAARQAGQDKSEATETVKSGLKGGMAKPRQMPVQDAPYVPTPSTVLATINADKQAPAASLKPFGHDAFRASEVASIDAPDQEWVIEDFVPLGHVTTLFGDGGVGKSLLVQTMGSHIASGEPFADRSVAKMRVAAIMCEDDAAELNRRQRRINARLFDDADVEDFTIVSRIGEDNVLGILGNGKWEPTKLYQEIEEWVCSRNIQVLILDNIMQVFGGDINDNQGVTWFVNSLTRLARRMGGAIILLGHIAKADGSKWSGSMAWNNSVRARLFLSRVEAQAGNPIELRQLSVEKSNYGKAGLTIELALHEGVLIDKRSLSKVEVAEVSERSKRARDAVRKLLERDGSVSMNHQADAYVFTPDRLMFLRRAGAPIEKEIKLAINQMLADETLVKKSLKWDAKDTRPRERLVLAATIAEIVTASPTKANASVMSILASMKDAA